MAGEKEWTSTAEVAIGLTPSSSERCLGQRLFHFNLHASLVGIDEKSLMGGRTDMQSD